MRLTLCFVTLCTIVCFIHCGNRKTELVPAANKQYSKYKFKQEIITGFKGGCLDTAYNTKASNKDEFSGCGTCGNTILYPNGVGVLDLNCHIVFVGKWTQTKDKILFKGTEIAANCTHGGNTAACKNQSVETLSETFQLRQESNHWYIKTENKAWEKTSNIRWQQEWNLLGPMYYDKEIEQGSIFKTINTWVKIKDFPKFNP